MSFIKPSSDPFSDFFQTPTTDQKKLFNISDELSGCCTNNDVSKIFEKRLHVEKLAVELNCQTRLSEMDAKYKREIAEMNVKHRSSIAEMNETCQASIAKANAECLTLQIERDNALNERDNALNERDIARQETRIEVARNELLLIEKTLLLKRIDSLKEML